MTLLAIVAVIWAQYQMGAALEFDLPKVDRSDKVCFYAQAPADEVMTCYLGVAGLYPPLATSYDSAGCCFDVVEGNGVFWALGEQHMSLAQIVTLPASTQPKREKPDEVPDFVWNAFNKLKARIWGGQRIEFLLKDAVLVDLLALDETDDSPVSGVRVSVADASMHLVSYMRATDSDGYAVLPMVAGAQYVVSMRASGFVQPSPLRITAPSNDSQDVEKIVVLSRGVTLSGKVADERGVPVSGAQLVVSVSNAAGLEVWNSTLDRPKAMSQTVTLNSDSPSWVPERPSVTCDGQGRFRVENVPNGQIQVYAAAPGYIPSDIVKLDAREENSFASLNLSVLQSHSAWVRVTNSEEVTVAAALDVVDPKTGYALDTLRVNAASSTKINGLPEKFDVTVRSEGCWPLRKSVDLTQGDELTFKLESSATAVLRGRVVDAQGQGISGVTLVGTTNNYANCLGKTNKIGVFELEDCPANGADFHVEALDYAPTEAHLDPNADNQIVLDHGVSLNLALPSNNNIICTIRRAQKDAPVLYRKSPSQNMIQFNNLARAEHIIECTADGAVPASLKWTPTGDDTDYSANIAFESLMEVSGVVLEKYSADASYAMVEVNGVRTECDEEGHFKVQIAQTDQIKVRANHWLYGQAELMRNANDKSEFVVRLDDEPPRGCAEYLQNNHIVTVVDGASLLIDEVGKASKWAGRGLKRGDFVESCNRKLVIVRDSKRIEFK